jgi:hypothetical protein
MPILDRLEFHLEIGHSRAHLDNYSLETTHKKQTKKNHSEAVNLGVAINAWV